MNLGEILGWSGGGLLLLLTLIQIAPIKINPWSRLARALGGAINADVLKELSDVKTQQKKTEEKLDKHILVDDERDADVHRQRILSFNADLMRGLDYNHEYFVDMLLEIDYYERFCESHPDYKNNRAVMAVANIKRVYEEHEIKGDFM